MRIARAVTLGLLACAAAVAQSVLDDPKKIADAGALLDTFGGVASGCEVVPVKPRLNFTLRLQTGYVASVPLIVGGAQKWIVLVRVTPKGKPAVYLSNVVELPAVPPGGSADHRAEIGGAYWVGEGHYDVKFLAFDSRGDACRGEWQIDTRLDPGERKATPVFAPGTVAEISWSGARAPRAKPVAEQITVLMDVVPELRTGRQVALMDALSALMEELPARQVRLVMFDLTQQKEIFRREGFAVEALPDVAKVIDAVQFEPVQVGALQNPRGGVDLIERLAGQELRSDSPSGALIFLGPKAFSNAKPSPTLVKPPGATQRFFYVHCVPAIHGSSVRGGPGQFSGGRMPGAPPIGSDGRGPSLNSEINGLPTWNNPNYGRDSVEYVVAQLGGKTLVADSPRTFAEAVAQIARQLGGKR